MKLLSALLLLFSSLAHAGPYCGAPIIWGPTGATLLHSTLCFPDGTCFGSSVSPAMSNDLFVEATGGSDSNDCSSHRPCLTVSHALSLIPAISSGTFLTSAAEAVIHVGPGIYSENLTLPTLHYLLFDLNGSEILGNVTLTNDMTKVPTGTTEPRYVFAGHDLRSMYTGINTPLVGVNGNMTVTTTGTAAGGVTWKPHVEFNHSGLSGNLAFNTGAYGAYQGFAMFDHAFLLGTLSTPGAGNAVSLYAWDCDSSSSKGLNALNGNIVLAILKNVQFTGTVVVSGSPGPGKLSNVIFPSGAHDFTGYSGALQMDANTYASYYANVPTKGSETATLVDTANGVGYTPSVSANWASVPTAVSGALDTLGARAIDQISGLIEVPTAKTYVLNQKAAFAYTIQSFNVVTSSGTITAALKINGTNVTGCNAISVTSANSANTCTAANAVVAGDTLTLVTTSNSSGADLAYSVKLLRN